MIVCLVISLPKIPCIHRPRLAVSSRPSTGFFGRVSLSLPCFYACRSCLKNCNFVRLPPFFSCVWRLLPSSWFSSASSVLRSLNSVLYLIFFFFFLVSFLWFWVSLSSFLLLSPLFEPSLLFFLLSVRSLLGAVAVTPPKKKKKKGRVMSSGPRQKSGPSFRLAFDGRMPLLQLKFV